MLMMGGYEINRTTSWSPSNYTTWLELGGRGIDTAYEYNTQHEIKAAIDASGIPRAELFITSKIPCSRRGDARWPNPMTAAEATRMVGSDLAQLGLDYIDLMLVHWPCITQAETAEVWAALEALVGAGKLLAIGVSNFEPADIDALISSATILPAVNQCAMAAGRVDSTGLAYCRAHNITYEAYGALHGPGMGSSTVARIATAHGVSSAAVLLRWIVQQGVVSVTASLSAEYDREDLEIFTFALSESEMQAIAAIQAA